MGFPNIANGAGTEPPVFDPKTGQNRNYRRETGPLRTASRTNPLNSSTKFKVLEQSKIQPTL
jgi:hypothetical protein